MTSIKKWITRGTGYEGFDSHFSLKRDALTRARQVLLSGKKKVIHVARFSEELYARSKRPPYKPGIRECFVNVETWKLVNGVPKKVK